jgi:hypothetical protein
MQRETAAKDRATESRALPAKIGPTSMAGGLSVSAVASVGLVSFSSSGGTLLMLTSFTWG